MEVEILRWAANLQRDRVRHSRYVQGLEDGPFFDAKFVYFVLPLAECDLFSLATGGFTAPGLDEALGGTWENAAKLVARHLLKACALMHRHNYLHLDISLENVLLMRTPDGRFFFQLCDFGQALRCPGEVVRGLPRGKLSYRPPEQATGIFTRKSDVFSVGATVFTFRIQRNYDFSRPDYRAMISEMISAPARFGEVLHLHGVGDLAGTPLADFFSLTITKDVGIRLDAEAAAEHPWHL